MESFLQNRVFESIPYTYQEESTDLPDFWDSIDSVLPYGSNGAIFFINANNNQEFDNYIVQNYEYLKEKFEEKGRTFFYPIDNTLPFFYDDFILCHFPFLDKKRIRQFSEKSQDVSLREVTFRLLEHLGFKKEITTGFLSFVDKNKVLVAKKDNESIESFVETYTHSLQTVSKHYRSGIRFSIGKPDRRSIVLDDEAKECVDIIKKQLEELVTSGQIFYVAPIIEDFYKDLLIEQPLLSSIVVTENYDIVLPEYQNMKITLSHLTKVIYFLFLRHAEGINLSELHLYKEELLLLYKNVSYRESLEQLGASIDNLVAPESTAIYMYLSRIKSAFVMQMTDNYARYYYVSGARNHPKYIDLDFKLIHWKCKF